MVEYGAATALIVTDVQIDFAHPEGSLYVRGGEEVVPVANGEIDWATSGGAMVVYTQDWHPPVTPHFQKDGGIWPVHCVRDTLGARFHPDLTVAGEVVRKGIGGEDGYSGFSVRDPITGVHGRTRLEGMLRDRGIERVVVLGIATDYCIKETVLDAIRLGFDTTVVAGGIRAVDLQPGDGMRALEAVQAAGARVE